MKDGHGKWRSQEGPIADSYEGQYKQDMKNGQGEHHWANGNYYKGGYKDDLKHGYGEMYWADGSCYKGEWMHGAQVGLGKKITQDGKETEGVFENNEFVGPDSPDRPKTIIEKKNAKNLVEEA